MEKRIITTDVTEEDISLEGNLRPQTLDDYIGQEKTKSTLKVYIEAAKQKMCIRDSLHVWKIFRKRKFWRELKKAELWEWAAPDSPHR